MEKGSRRGGESEMMRMLRPSIAGFQDGRKGLEPKNAGSLLEARKACINLAYGFFLGASRKNSRPADILN